MAVRLSDLTIGQQAKVLTIQSQDEAGWRILEMGVTPGVTLKLVGVAPLGDPLAFEVRGYRLSLRRVEAALVEVERL